MQTTYRTGQWYILVAPGALIALAPDAPDELVARLWEREQTSGDLAAVIDPITEQAEGSFADMLPFAAVVLEGPNARIAVRGDVTVQVTGADGPESFTGANVTTWSERFVPIATRLEITAGADEGGAALPIAGGIVRAGYISADVEQSDVEQSDVEQSALVAADAATEEPVTGAVVEDSAAEEDADEDAPIESSPAEVPVAEEPAADAPADDAPTADAQAEEPAAEDPAPVEPVTAQIPENPEPTEDEVDGVTLVPSDGTDTSEVDIFDQLFGATVTSSGAPVPPPAPPAAVAGDHDGATISVAEARALRQNAPAAGPDAPTAVMPVVPGSTGRIRVSTGQSVSLDRTVIIGRRPRSTRASGADLPHLIAVESPQQDISRSHLEIRPEGDTVVVVDLHTTNGSTLLRPGADPLRLHPGEPTLVLSADVVDLGDGVTVVFEDLP